MNTASKINEFYKDKSVFVTGGTGFLGKSLIEKLLRSCSEVKTIYVLIRKKKDKSATERLYALFDNQLFGPLSKINPDFKKKIVAIEGDLEYKGLGISEQDRKILIENVNIVFHSAATVRFNEPLKVAVRMNILGVKEVIDLCKELKNLSIFVHISTAYANCVHQQVKEEVYNSPMKPKNIIEAIELFDDDIINHLTSKIIGSWPNTYTYTKAIAESLVLEECESIPCAIVRPSIVGSAWKEPIPGWIDTFNGQTSFFWGVGSGFVKSILGKQDAIIDFIPLDVVVNLIIASAWYREAKSPQRIPVYNCTSGQINKLTLNMIKSNIVDSFKKNPLENALSVPKLKITPYRTIRHLRENLEEKLPSYLMDFFLKITNQKQFCVHLQNKASNTMKLGEYYSENEWQFENDNFLAIINSMNDHDKKEFCMDIRTLNWISYLEQYCLGIKTILLKEDISKIDNCRIKLAKKQTKQSLIFYSSVLIVIYYLYKQKTIENMFLSFFFKFKNFYYKFF